MTVSGSFQTLLSQIQPREVELQAAERHYLTVRSRLASVFNVKKFVLVGSHARGTSIRGKSDVDLFVVVSRDDARWGGRYISSNTMLDNFRRELEGRYWNSTVYKDVHAVVVDFSDSRVEVVPAFFVGTTTNNWPLYAMPDGTGEWMPTSPELHNSYLRKADEESRGKLRGTSQLMKFWRECRSSRVPISSCYIELLLARDSICKGVISYANCLTRILEAIAAQRCQSMKDPKDFSEDIRCVKTTAQRPAALASVEYSVEHARKACEAEPWNTDEAKRQWDIVFNKRFPW